jgi:hypothetical protein
VVGEFLQRQLARHDPWNCSTLVADWLIECGYPDYAERYRDLTDPAECEAIAAAHGGLGTLWESLFQGVVPWAEAPWQAGDVGVVTLGGFEAGAVFSGERWALRQSHGLVFAGCDQVAVARGWRP